MNLTLIETAGNQAFIFATNKLRENVGASELTARAGTQFVLEAVRDEGGPDLRIGNMSEIRAALRDPQRNRPIDADNPVEVILSVSGKALLLVRDETLGRKIVSRVTRRALKESPGLEVRGVVSSSFELEKDSIHQAIKNVHREFESVRSRLPGPTARFQRLPIVAECSTSGLPAMRYAGNGDQLPSDEHGPRSAQSLAKLKAREGWQQRLKGLLKANQSSVKLPYSTTDIESLDCDWLAIVHADGNGLGRFFLKFDEYIKSDSTDPAARNRAYINQLRQFSLALDECTERAFCRSLSVLRSRKEITPIVPLVLGGDDLTVVCDGRQALQFTKKFIECFERETTQHEGVTRIVAGGVTSCAGVAIVKPHFPFFAGYQLAEELLKSAKEFKPQSAIDYHILYDASGPDLARIRRELTIGDTQLVARPYLVRPGNVSPGRTWADLERRIAAVCAPDRDDDGRHRLPNSMLHELREGLFLGRDAAEARLRLVLDRYRSAINPLLADENLFWNDGQRHVTGLLDAVDTAEFWNAEE